MYIRRINHTYLPAMRIRFQVLLRPILPTFLLSVFLCQFVEAQNYNLTHLSTYTFTNQRLSNIWGYAAGGNEYALVGAQNGLTILNVTNPASPTFITQIPGNSSNWREIRTYQHYAYVTSEHNVLQIVDLTNLPNSNVTSTTYTGNGAAAGLTKAHALDVDETLGFLYLYGTNLFNGSGVALCFSLASPMSPSYVGKFDGPGYTHDGYADNNLLYAANIYAGVVSVVDMTNKSAPVLLGSIATPNAFPHNTWRSGNTLFTTDEKPNSFLAAYNLNNYALQDKIQVTPGSNSIVHNTHVINDYAVTSWYRDGVVVVDVSRPQNLVVVGHYDTYTCASGSGFDGCWGVYPYLPSGNILMSNILACGSSANGEMMIFSPTYVRGCYVEGQITNASNGAALNAATVQLLSTNTSETSAANGQYKMGQHTPGAFTARVSKTGFVTQNIPVTLTNGVVTTLNVALVPNAAPVELLRFDAQADGGDALLHWETAYERDNAGFEVQHRTASGNWRTTGWQPASETGEEGARYDFRVPELPAGEHFFRLRQTDFSGASVLSDQRAVRILGEKLRVSLRHNPVRDGVCDLRVFSEKEEVLYVEIFSALGQKVGAARVFDIEKGEASVSLEVRGLAVGTYRLVLRTSSEALGTIGFSVLDAP